jgi:hypothetical protein
VKPCPQGIMTIIGGVGILSIECSCKREMAPVRRHDVPVQLLESDMASSQVDAIVS